MDGVLADNFIFTKYEKNERKNENGIPKVHYKFYFTSLLDDTEKYILLDILYEDNPFVEMVTMPIESTFLITDGDPVNVLIPTIDCILSDKLTAFAPNTTGIPYGKDKELEIMKRVLSSSLHIYNNICYTKIEVKALKEKRGRGYVYSIQYHLVWCVKYRKKILKDNIEDTLKMKLKQIALENKFDILEMECDKDHIHLLVDCSPQHYIPNIIKALKGVSARAMFKEHPEIKNELWGGSLWNPSYYVSTISDTTEEQIRRYIQSQKEK